jgi:acetyltransferase-like isoleucine patch superfamily enzyme
MKVLFRQILRYLAFRTGKFKRLYLKYCRPASDEYAAYLKINGKLHGIGSQCRINPYANITHPEYVTIGNNVTLSYCNLLGRDDAVDMLNQAYQMALDSTGKIVIHDNVFIGHGATIMPNVTIGANVIVAAGAVVMQDIAEGLIVGGQPAKPIGYTEELAHRLEVQTEHYPWVSVIKKRTGAFDPTVEAELIAMRVKYFYP